MPVSLETYKRPLDLYLRNSPGDLTPVSSTRVAKAREKLKKLTKIQFSDLSTDVFDEMKRRELVSMDPDNNSLPKFLASQSNYHPKRNQARQKLAALPPSRFKDLVNDVLYEIDSRISEPSTNSPALSNNGFKLDSDAHANNEVHDDKEKVDPSLEMKKNPNNLKIDVEKSNLYKAPSSKISPITPSQREIKATTLIPKKAELTWSSDEESELDENIENDFNKYKKIGSKDYSQNLDSDVTPEINRSPSKRDTIATNEVLNEHALPHVKFPVDGEDDDDKFANLDAKEDLEKLNQKLMHDLEALQESYDFKVNELEALKQINSLDHEKQLSVEDSKEFDNLKNYLDRVLEENEELKVKLASNDNTHDHIVEEVENLKHQHEDLMLEHIKISDAYDQLKNEHEELIQFADQLKASNEKLNGDYKNLQNETNKLSAKVEEQKKDLLSFIPPITPTANTISSSVNQETSSVLEWQDKFENLRADKFSEQLTALNLNAESVDKNLFSSNGVVSINKLSSVYSSLETILIYLNSKNENTDSSAAELKKIDPTILFQRVATLVGHANDLSQEIKTEDVNPRILSLIRGKKRILSNAISNVLSTTKYFALYHHVLPNIVLNAALYDVYFAICDLVSLVKINRDVSNEAHTQETETAMFSETPIALGKMRSIDNLNSSPFKETTSSGSGGVRPLRITQRLASGSQLDLLQEPSKPVNDRSSSPMSKILNNSILPVVVSNNGKATQNNKTDKINANKTKVNATPSYSGSTLSLDNVPQTEDKISNLESHDSNEILSDTVIESPEKPLNFSSSKDVVDSKAQNSKTQTFSVEKGSPNQTIDSNIVSPNNFSPIKGKNILEKMKQFDTSTSETEDTSFVKTSSVVLGSPISTKSNKSKVGVAVDRFGAAENFHDTDHSEITIDTSNVKDSTMKEIGAVDDKAAQSPLAEASGLMEEPLQKDVRNTAMVDNPFIDTNTIKGENKLLPQNVSKNDDEQVDFNDYDRSSEIKPSKSTESLNEDDLTSKSNVPSIGSTDVFDKPEASMSDFKDVGSDLDVPLVLKKESDSIQVQQRDVLNANETEPCIVEPIAETLHTPGAGLAPSSNIKLQPSSAEDDELQQRPEAPLKKTNDDNELKGPEALLKKKNEVRNQSDSVQESGSQSQDKDDSNQVGFSRNANTVDAYSVSGATDRNPVAIHEEILGKHDVGKLTPSAGNALEIDEGLVRRVSKRLSKRLSRKNDLSLEDKMQLQHQPYAQREPVRGWEYDGMSDEDYEDEDEFDIDKFNTLNPDNTLRELLLYLEHQTVEVIGAIQQTLETIRDPKATKVLLKNRAGEINKVVKQMSEGTTTLMKQTRYAETMGHATYVVNVLEECVRRMEVLYGDVDETSEELASKSFKQRSAGIAFDVARSTKELVKTVEEATLRDEIAVLDSKLRGT